ncbi:restriction endonuclease subunit S [Vibrio neptunius]|uniref:restriction endonuclease subunit S n=1 Tax=Vibrio neptunius TaxID=170651 RepID=UPI0019D23FEE|nr:restriction endonuclease subunit S [Vibrio neptunius]MBN3573251.1 restriction endonuclease subunit S [Vibrio neptunius]
MSLDQTPINQLITDNIDTWTSTVKTKATTGRGSSKKLELYGVKKLRELILELAVRGKLVPQDPSDEPASVLLERIAAEKAKLVKAKKIKKQKSLGQVSKDEELFDTPTGWAWTRISEIAEISPRNSTTDDDAEVSFVPMPLITTNYDGSHGSEKRIWKEIKKGYTHFQDGDIALAKITPCFENSKAAVFSGLEGGVGAGTTELHVARPLSDCINPLFVLLYLKAPIFLKVGETKMTGSAGQKRVPKDFFSENPLPFPPSNEQHRIVAKVDELMTLCDQLEQQTEASIEAHQVLVTTLLNTLTNSANAEELMQNWARISEHFDTLFTTEESIDQLKQTILQLAVMGKLVPQDSTDAPASVLLKKIKAKKEQLINDGILKKVKKAKVHESILTDENIPYGWSAVDFGDITFNLDAKRVPLSVTERKGREGVYDYYGASGVIDSIDDYLFDKPLLLIGEDGANLVNRSTPIAFIARGKYWVNNHAHVIDGISEYFLTYLSLYINSISLIPYITGIAQPKMNQAKMNAILVLLPPENEQRRIITKVDELMILCDQLKVRLKESQKTQLHITDAIVEQAV